MISVLVTGSNGQLGKCLQDISINTTGIKWIFKSSTELDITNENSILDAFKNHKIDYLINCAAYTAVDRAESEKEKAFLVNAEGVRLLATICKDYSATLIHISTDFVFDGKKHIPYLETDQPNPINVYGTSKLKGEEYVQEILERFFIIRTSWVYSRHGNNFVKTMLKLGKERNEIKVVNDQIGSPTNANDLAEFLIFILNSNEKENGIYHYSNEGNISWYDFAKEIFAICENDIKLIPITSNQYPTPASRPKNSILSKDKIKVKYLKEVPHWRDSLKDILKQTIDT
ncbi:dTDP-4-dehydrorhamnose reductase [Confluentibacter sediminis]|uniref:dTDP-4-dehydrorhamnose reductase n=1 Tax=Confluentibacter sediminis TaxID=2219045 RepID=UPI000DAF0C28|nr:dTDP-4-dehydrorhamnose reductase [Confluentibacter sediminis]